MKYALCCDEMSLLKANRREFVEMNRNDRTLLVPWEPTTFIFGGYKPYIEGVKKANFMVLGSKGTKSSMHES